MSAYDDDDHHHHHNKDFYSAGGRSDHPRDHSPSYGYGGDGPARGNRPASPGRTTYDGRRSRQRLTYEPQDHEETSSRLRVPDSDSRGRPRSLPPRYDRAVARYASPGAHQHHHQHHLQRRPRGDSPSSSRSPSPRGDRDDRSPLGRAHRALDNTFTDSRTGLGVGVLGALVGGLAGHEATEAAVSRRSSGSRDRDADKRNQLIGTVVGAAVGALGANAVEKKLEDRREKDRHAQLRWERKWRPDGGDEPPETSRHGRARADRETSRQGWDREHGFAASPDARERGTARGRARSIEREVDPDAKSWRDVADWVYDGNGGSRDRERDRAGSSRGWR